MQCFECGLDLDDCNESQPVCPQRGTDPAQRRESTLDPELLLGPLAGVFAEMFAQKLIEEISWSKPVTPGNDLVN